MTASELLTFGQLSTWRSLESIPPQRRPEGNLRRAWPLPTDCRVDDVRAALAVLVRAHESLRTTFHTDADGTPSQLVRTESELPLDTVACDAASEADATDVAVELMSRPFDFAEEVGWRARLILVRNRPAFLCLGVAHLVADKWALDGLAGEFRSALRAVRAGTADDFATGPRPRDLTSVQRSPAWQARRAGARAYWEGLLRQAPPAVFPPPIPGLEPGRIQAVLRSRDLRANIEDAAVRTASSAQSVLLALMSLALSDILGVDRFPMTLMSSNRSDPTSHRLVSSMNQLIPIVANVDPGASLGEHITAMHWTAIRAHRHACYDVDEIGVLSAAVAQERGEGLEYDYWYNFMAPADRLADRTHATDAAVEWTPPSRVTGPRFDVKVGGRAEATVTVRVAKDLFTEETVRLLLRLFETGARRALDDPSCGLTKLLQECR